MQRKRLRLPDYDYAAAGAYFVTVCIQGRRMILAQVESESVRLSPIGEIVNSVWNDLPLHFPHVKLDEFIVMPNHVHGIVWILENEADPIVRVVGAQHAAPLLRKTARVIPGSLGAIVRSFKSAATREVNKQGLNDGQPLWQRNFCEHVIRDEDDLYTHRRYIQENPLKLHLDEYHA